MAHQSSLEDSQAHDLIETERKIQNQTPILNSSSSDEINKPMNNVFSLSKSVRNSKIDNKSESIEMLDEQKPEHSKALFQRVQKEKRDKSRSKPKRKIRRIRRKQKNVKLKRKSKSKKRNKNKTMHNDLWFQKQNLIEKYLTQK